MDLPTADQSLVSTNKGWNEWPASLAQATLTLSGAGNLNVAQIHLAILLPAHVRYSAWTK
jgi:hypothetical protein